MRTKITADQLERTALVYVRQSTPGQVHDHAESSSSTSTNARSMRSQDVPVLWHEPATDMRLKQRIVRILIHEIIADVDDDSRAIVLVIHWQGAGRPSHRGADLQAREQPDDTPYGRRGDRAGAPHGRSVAR